MRRSGDVPAALGARREGQRMWTSNDGAEAGPCIVPFTSEGNWFWGGGQTRGWDEWVWPVPREGTRKSLPRRVTEVARSGHGGFGWGWREGLLGARCFGLAGWGEGPPCALRASSLVLRVKKAMVPHARAWGTGVWPRSGERGGGVPRPMAWAGGAMTRWRVRCVDAAVARVWGRVLALSSPRCRSGWNDPFPQTPRPG